MAIPLDPKEIVTIQELAISNMLEIEALRQLLYEKRIITGHEFIAKFKKLDREMKEGRKARKTKVSSEAKYGSRGPFLSLTLENRIWLPLRTVVIE